MKWFLKISAIVVIALLVLTFPYWIGAVFFYLAPEAKSQVVTSPDGKYQAWVGTRGWMDSHNIHLYVRRADGSDEISTRVPISSEVAWSPDSSKVALGGFSSAYGSEIGFLVYDVRSRHMADVGAKSLGRAYGASQGPAWITNSKLVVAPRHWIPDDGFERVIAKVRVESSAKGLSIVDLGAEKKPKQ